MPAIIRELQYVFRRLRSTPGFTIAATCTLAIAIGATASVFGLVDGVLLKPFPFREPDRVFAIVSSNPVLNLPRFSASPADFIDWRAQSTAFSAISASESGDVTVTGMGEPERLTGRVVTPSTFAVLGVTTTVGRPLAQDSAGPAEVVIGFDYWQRRFGGSASALGRTILLDNKPYTIVGVMPRGVPGSVDVWTRLSFTADDFVHRDVHYVGVAGRLRPGITRAAAQREMETIAGRLAQAYPHTNANWSALLVPLPDQLVGPVRPALVMLIVAAACVLLIGAANIANLFLVRGLARQRELAVRSALGATRGRLVRELIAEAATMGLAAGALGVGIAVAGIRVLRTLAPPTLPRLSSIAVDGRVVAFCALTSVVAVFIFGALPALQASSGNLAAFLKDGGRSTGTGKHRRLQDGLVVLQVSVALVLLTGAGLLAESFAKFRNTDQGFSPEGVMTAEIALGNERYPTADREAAFAATVVEQLAAQPGVEAASASSALPGGADIRWTFTVLGDPPPDPSHLSIARPVYVSPDYLRTMQIRLRRGRGVLPTDDRHAVKIAVVDELFVKRFFGSRDPIGQRLAFYHSPPTDTLTIVGVVAAVRQGGLVGEDVPLMYMSLAQSPFPGLLAYVSLRTSGRVAGQQAALKETIAGVDRTVPVYDIKTLNDRLIESVGLTRFSSFLASVFAVVALVLGVVGIYGVLAYVAGQRQREIAVRIALGASRARVMGDVLRRALVLLALGIAVGSGAAWVFVSTLAGLIAGVNPHDPDIFMAAAAAFSAVALAAASVPAYRTTRISPVVALTSA